MILLICNFSDCVIFHKLVSNVVNIVEINEVWKCRWTNSTKVCVNYVTIHLTRLEILTLIWVRTFFKMCTLYINDKHSSIINTSKKENPHLYEGSQFQIWLLYGDIIDTDVCGIFSSTSTCWYLIFLHRPYCPRLTPIYKKWHSSKTCKLQTSRQESVFTTHARNRLYWSLHRGTLPVQIGTLITAQCRWIHRRLFNCGVHDNVALQLSPREHFYLQLFNLRHFLHKSVSNVVNLWSLKLRKCGIKNVDVKRKK